MIAFFVPSDEIGEIVDGCCIGRSGSYIMVSLGHVVLAVLGAILKLTVAN